MFLPIFMTGLLLMLTGFGLIGLEDKSRKGLNIWLQTRILPLWTYYGVIIIYTFIVQARTLAFWAIFLPVIFCALVAQRRVRRSCTRRLRLKGVLEVGEDREIVPRGRILLVKIMTADFSAEKGRHQSPFVIPLYPGDPYNPDPSGARETELIWLLPGEERTLRTRRSPSGIVRNYRFKNHDGHLQIKRQRRNKPATS